MRWLIVAVGLCGARVASAKELDEVAKLADALFAQDASLFTPDANVVANSEVTPAATYLEMFPPPSTGIGEVKDSDRAIALSHDGKTAWVSQTTTWTLAVEHGEAPTNVWRTSEVVVKTPKGWRVAVVVATDPVADAVANRAAIAGKLSLDAIESGGDDGLRAAFAKLAATGFDKPDAVLPGLIVFGSAPGERTTSGPAFAKAWNAAWAKHVDLDGAIATLAPSKTTGWVIANVKLHKTKGRTKYDIPFRLCFVFDKDAAGAWQLVHAHFAVPSPDR